MNRLGVKYAGKARQLEEGLSVLSEALTVIETTGGRFYEAEVHRLTGELPLQLERQEQETTNREQEAETYFLKARAVAQHQHAKSLELRAVMSLVRLRQRQAQEHGIRTTQHESHLKLAEAHTMLSNVYHWFTEGFDTKDLQETKVLLASCT